MGGGCWWLLVVIKSPPMAPFCFRVHFHSLLLCHYTPCYYSQHPQPESGQAGSSGAGQHQGENPLCKPRPAGSSWIGGNSSPQQSPTTPMACCGAVPESWLPRTSPGSGLPFQLKQSELCSCAYSGCVPFSSTLTCVLGALHGEHWFTAQMVLGLARGWFQGSVNSPKPPQRGKNLEYHHSCL